MLVNIFIIQSNYENIINLKVLLKYYYWSCIDFQRLDSFIISYTCLKLIFECYVQVVCFTKSMLSQNIIVRQTEYRFFSILGIPQKKKISIKLLKLQFLCNQILNLSIGNTVHNLQTQLEYLIFQNCFLQFFCKIIFKNTNITIATLKF